MLKTSPCAGGRLLDESGQKYSGGTGSEMYPGHRGDTPLFPGDAYRVFATYIVPKDTQGQLTWECSVGISAPLRFRFDANGGESGIHPALPPLTGEGKAFQVGGVQVGVTGVSREAQQEQSTHYARPGAQWVTVEVSLENVADQSPKGYEPGDFYLTDNNGFRYPRRLLASNQIQLRPLFPGDALRGNLDFDVNDTATGLVLNYGSPGQPVVRIGLD
jgi:hypothetical protein